MVFLFCCKLLKFIVISESLHVLLLPSRTLPSLSQGWVFLTIQVLTQVTSSHPLRMKEHCCCILNSDFLSLPEILTYLQTLLLSPFPLPSLVVQLHESRNPVFLYLGIYSALNGHRTQESVDEWLEFTIIF